MSRKGNCLDNSLAENFFGLIKSELFYMKEYKTIEELETDIIEYIDYYNNKRIKGKLKGMRPYTIQSSFPSCLIPNQKMSNFLGSVQNLDVIILFIYLSPCSFLAAFVAAFSFSIISL